ncbi:hypothetical protein [Loktanella sp. Alg231-35]|uniref:hypothetical protein n=1 Tax=Loktanella sp. Alg231-35 TaxID=1922220 RepID=UPI00131EF5ED|nr:hypothetical protein [Loktanella sp. Alg231-35]
MAVLFKRLPADRALVWSLLGALLFLPEETYFDFPVVPTMNKETLPSVVAMLLCLFMVPQKIRFFPQSRLATMLILGFLISPLLTYLNNTEAVFWGPMGIPGLSWKDGLANVLRHAMTLIPFVLGYNLINNAEARKNFLTIYMIAGLIYSVPMLLEVRLSPQINLWVYGFLPELFGQQIRFDGFRPVVFMRHGLNVAFFAAIAVLAAATLLRGQTAGGRARYLFILFYLFVVLVFCKSVGSILFAVVFVPIIVLAGVRLKGWAIMVSALLVLTYPVLRAADLIPTKELVSYAAMIQEDRSLSLDFRFFNEAMLLEHASKKPITGWGTWDRNRVFDSETGDDISVTDGFWVIVIGVMGWVGYISVFGLLTLPLLRLWRWRKRKAEFKEPHIVYGIALMLAVSLLELIPNATITPMTWLIAGMLLRCRPQDASDIAKPEHTAEDESTAPRLHVRQRRGQKAAAYDAPALQTHQRATR